MEFYRNLDEYMAAKHLQRNEVIESVAEAALTILQFVDERCEFEVKDIMKLSEPLHTLYDIVTKV